MEETGINSRLSGLRKSFFPNTSLTKHIFYPPYTIIAHLSGKRKSYSSRNDNAGRINSLVQQVYPAIILFFCTSRPARMHLSYSFHQRPMRQKIHFGRVDHELLDIIFYYNTQLLLRKYRFFLRWIPDFQCLGKYLFNE